MFKIIFLWVFLFILSACSVSEKFSNTKESVPLTTENKENVVINNEEKTEIVEEKERKMEEDIKLPKVEDNEPEKLAEVPVENNLKELNKTEQVLIITEPKIIGNDSYDLKGNRIEIKGTNIPNVSKIKVLFTNDMMKDEHILTKFKLGDTEWKYIADEKYGNLADGDNSYEIQAFTEASGENKLISTQTIIIKAEIPKTTVLVPVGNKITVDFYDVPQKMDNKIFLESIDQWQRFSNAQNKLEEEGYDDHGDLSIFNIGIVLSGTYQNNNLIEIITPAYGMVSGSVHRTIKKEDELILLEKMSDEINIDYSFFKFVIDKETTISNLLPPSVIIIPKTKYFITRQNGDLCNRYYSNSSCREEYEDINKLNKLFFSSEINQDFFTDESNCIVTKNADSSYSKYYINFGFNADNSPNISSGKIKIIWQDNSFTEDFYKFSERNHCFKEDCYDVLKSESEEDVFIKSRLIPTGKINSFSELTVYEELYSEAEIQNIIMDKENRKKTNTSYFPTVNAGGSLGFLSDFYDAFYSENKPDFRTFMASHPVIYINDPFNRTIRLTKQGYVPAAECGKPVIYLYPEVETDVSVKVFPTGGFTKTEPAYNTGWQVRATPKSEIYNYADKKDYPYLFWEGKAIDYKMPDKGFVIAKADLQKTLTEKLALLGLNEIETADFMEFWYPKMLELNKPYYFVTFVPQAQFNLMAPLQVKPQPDSIIRVFMDYKGLDEKIIVEPLEIKTPKRTGFTVIEWGGNLRR